MDHSAHSCAHNALKFCGHCNTVWCQACKVEWRQNPLCLLNHYPTYYHWPQPYYTTPVTGLLPSALGTSNTSPNASNLTLTAGACAHGDS